MTYGILLSVWLSMLKAPPPAGRICYSHLSFYLVNNIGLPDLPFKKQQETAISCFLLFFCPGYLPGFLPGFLSRFLSRFSAPVSVPVSVPVFYPGFCPGFLPRFLSRFSDAFYYSSVDLLYSTIVSACSTPLRYPLKSVPKIGSRRSLPSLSTK